MNNKVKQAFTRLQIYGDNKILTFKCDKNYTMKDAIKDHFIVYNFIKKAKVMDKK